MGTGFPLPNVDASVRGGVPVGIQPIHKECARTLGLIHFVDPLAMYPNTANGQVIALINDMANPGRPWRASPSFQPLLYTDGAVANGRTLFDMRAAAIPGLECGLTSQDATFTSSFTFVTMIVPELATINGSVAAYLFRVIDPGVTARFSFLSNTGSPLLLLREDTLSYGTSYGFGAALQVGVPAVIGCSVDQATRKYSIYLNDGTVPVASAIVTSVASYPTARYVLFGAKVATASLRGRAGIAAIFNRKLPDGQFSDMQNIMQQFRTYYGITI